MRLNIIISMMLMLTTLLYAREFSVQNKRDNKTAGPFELKDGAEVLIDDNKYILGDIDEFGTDTFTLSLTTGDKFGPFNVRNGSRMDLKNNQVYTLLIKSRDQEEEERQERQERHERHEKIEEKKIAKGEEFSIQDKKENRIICSFTLGEGAKVSIDDDIYTVGDKDKFGKGTFTMISETGDKFGPFSAKNGSRIVLTNKHVYILLIDKAKEQEKDKEEKIVKGTRNSDILIKIENLLDNVEENFTAAVKAPKEGAWLKEYMAKLNELKLLSRQLQNEVMSEFSPSAYNISKYPISITLALSDCRRDYAENGFCLKVRSSRRNNRPVSNRDIGFVPSSRADFRNENFSDCKTEYINSGIHDALTKAANVKYRKTGNKMPSKLSTGFQDLVLTVSHFREDIMKLEKTGKWNALKRNGKIYTGSGTISCE